MVGVGDVVLSERVVAYEPAALVRAAAGSAVRPRPEIDRAPHTMIQDVHAYRGDTKRLTEAFVRTGGAVPMAPAGKEEEFREHVAGAVAARLGTLASGEKLLRDPSKLVELREGMHGRIEAGEMEAAGVVEACRRKSVPWLVVRGISDFGDELKDDRFHGFAARAAAAVLVDFVAWGLDLRDPNDAVWRLFAPRTLAGVPPGRNPFVFGRPIDQDEDFVGREDQKRRILDAIEKDQPVQILGEKLMGKTSLLKWVQRHVLPDRAVVSVDPTRGLTPASMVLAIAEALGKPEAAAALARPKATAREAAQALDALVPFVLLMDDADALASQGRGFDDGFFGVLRSHVQHRRLMWISASRRNLYDLFKGKDLPSEFLNDAVKVWVGRLDAPAARTLAERGVPTDVEAVLTEAAGLAYGLHWLGDYLHRRPRAVEAACDAFANEVEPTFRWWWDGLDVQGKQMVRACLETPVKVGELERNMRRRLRSLVERGFITEREGRFVVEGEAWRGFVSDAG
jgi:nucleoside phosphorylase